MKKRILSLFLAVVLLFAALGQMLPTASAATYSGTCGDNLTWSLDIKTGALTIFGAGTMTDSPWSSYSDIITSVQINNGVTNIKSGAFSDCSILTSVTIPDSVTSIGGSAFKSCSSLTSITIPDSVTSIGNSAFESCSNLTSLTIPDSVTSIGQDAFYYCTSLTSVKMGSSVTDIGNYAFEDCINLTSLSLPVGITTIGAGTFHNCDSLTSITIPDGVTTIGYYAFENCNNLISVTIPSSVTSIGQDAFYYCTSLTSVTFSNALKSIGSDAFAGCSSLTNVTIPGSVTSIGDSAFSNCGSLSAIWVDEENQYYSSDANGVLFNKEKTTLIQCPGGYSSSYMIPDSITSISNDAFYRCNSLTSVTIPSSVTSIGNYAFTYCNSLSAIWVDEENQSYSSDANGVLFNKTKTTLIQCPCGYSGSCMIPDSVTTLGSYAFFTCNNLTSILVDESNQHFSSDANGVLFNKEKTRLIRCPGAYSGSYTIPDGVTSIGSKAFYICDSLTSVTIPDSVTSIGDSAFCFCGSLKSATIGNSVKSINYSAFASCTSLSSVTIPNSVKSLGSWAFSECDSLTSVTIPDSVTSLDAATFYSCDNLTSVIIGNGLTTTALSMFEYCGSLTSITFGNSITSIGVASFSNCTALTSITIPDGVTKISSSAFKSCTSLLSVTIPNSVTTIDSYAFHDCSNLTSVMIPDGVTSIGQQAFSSCANLTSMTIPSSVTSINYKAFYNCDSLANIYFAGTETQWTAAIASDAVGRNVTVHFGSTDAIEGTCGENLQWSLNNGVLKISGTGAMEDYSSYNTVPWYQYRLDFSNVTIDDGVTSIGNYAFYDCDNLISVRIPDGVTSIGKYAFGDCYTLTSVTFPDGLTSIGDYAFYYSCLSDVSFPDSLKTIGESAFSDCYCLTSVTIPAGVTSIGKYAFRFAATLTAFDVDEANLYYSSDDSGILFDKEKTTLIQCPRTYSGAYTIPDGVASIEAYAFPHCTELTSVTIPESVASIGESAFMDCSALTSITIPDSITSIGASAFRDCSSLTSITIPESVRSIEEYTFHFCNNLTDVYYGGTEAQWNEISISSVANSCLTDATIHFAKATIVDATLNPTMNISAGAEMSVSYSFPASKVSEFEDFYLLVEKEMADGETVSTTYGVVEEKSTRSTNDRQPLTVKYHPETGEAMMYTVTYKGINAKEMGDSFTTTLYGVTADGTVYSSLVEATSMKDYLLSRFHAADASAELKTMVIDMLKYGAAAQGRLGYNTENLVTADLTEEELSYATQEIPEAVNHAASTGEGASVNTNITVGARVQLNLSCIYTTATAPETIKCVITDSEGKVLSEIATTNKNNIMFTAIYENVGAKEMRDVISATFYEGETAISKTISWSVESYVAQVRAKTNVTEDELNMVNTMLTYGDSVAAYMKAK